MASTVQRDDMDTAQALGSAMGLGLLAGIRLYATVFALGLAIRMGWFQPGESFAQLDVLARTPVLAVSGTAFAIEFFADKIPWLDSLWDSVHTFIRPIGAAALGATALGSFDSTTTTLLALLCGGVAFTGHTSKAATRLIVNHSPEPFSNIGLSLAEDLMIPAGLWLAFQHPEIAIAFVLVFLALFAWLSPKLFRLLTISWTALRCMISRLLGQSREPVGVVFPERAGAARAVLEMLPFRYLPENYARKLGGVSSGILCVAGSNVPGLKNSTGYLCPAPQELVFIARRMFLLRVYRIPWENLRDAQSRRGVFLDRLVLKTVDQELRFDVFKGRSARRREVAPAWQA
jgi:Domain of unknown function (DUF4126)